MIKAPPTPKGFRDIQPENAKRRRAIINQIAEVLEKYGFEPMETPTIEFAETLEGKYGDEERLIYKFEDRGGRKLALRYDLTVPLARYIATYNPTLPFRRYQIGQVFRGENPQKGRWREFTQFDFDTVGLTKNTDSSFEEDAKIIAASLKAVQCIGLNKARMAINNRVNFTGIPIDVIRAFDKKNKIGIEGVAAEIAKKGYTSSQFEKFQEIFTVGNKDTLTKLFSILKNQYGLKEDADFFFEPALARGLDYYTSTIIELYAPEYGNLSLGGGGRYDNLIGAFSKNQIPAVGFSFGVDRLIETLYS